MQCRNCGATIADKALICYKCGTATTEAKYQPAPLPSGRGRRSGLVATVIAIVLLIISVVWVERTRGGDSSQQVVYVAVAAAVIIIGIRAYARRR